MLKSPIGGVPAESVVYGYLCLQAQQPHKLQPRLHLQLHQLQQPRLHLQLQFPQHLPQVQVSMTKDDVYIIYSAFGYFALTETNRWLLIDVKVAPYLSEKELCT